MKNTTYISIIFFSVFFSVRAQNEPDSPLFPATPRSSYRYGLFGHSNINLHNPDFQALPGTENCCKKFDEGFGLSLSAGAFFDYYITPELAAELRLGFTGLSGDITAEEYIPFSEIQLEGQGLAIVEHFIQTQISSVSVEAMVRYSLFNGFSLLGGFNGAFVAGGDFYQEERLMEPENRGTFENGLRVRNRQNGAIQDLNKFMIFMNVGISYDLPLNIYETIFLSPEAILSYGLNDFLKDDKWKLNIFRVGLSLSYYPFGEASTPLEPFHD